MVASIGKCNEIPQSQIQSRRCEIIIGRIDRCIMLGELPDVPGYADLPNVTSAGFGTGYRCGLQRPRDPETVLRYV